MARVLTDGHSPRSNHREMARVAYLQRHSLSRLVVSGSLRALLLSRIQGFFEGITKNIRWPEIFIGNTARGPRPRPPRREPSCNLLPRSRARGISLRHSLENFPRDEKNILLFSFFVKLTRGEKPKAKD